MNPETLKRLYHRENWRVLLNDLFGSNFKAFSRVDDLQVENQTAKSAVQLGEINLASGDVLAVYEVELQDHIQVERNKVAIRNLLRTYWNKYDGAFIANYKKNENIWRFSFVSETHQYDAEGNYGKVTTAAKRFTYVLGQDESIRTATERFKVLAATGRNTTLEDIKGAFNVDPLSKEFFNGYKAQYEKFCNFMQTDTKMQYDFRKFLADGTNKAIRDYVKKMLGRIVFLHFLQKKGWMGVDCDSTLWIGGDPNFIENLFGSSSAAQQDNFLDEVLEPMFFHSLNKLRPNDWYNTKTALGIVKIPYLNGGLFEPDKLDEPDSKFPSDYFKELFAFFNRYNFTIEENDPNDAEVGVDPEMLGHIFENLLEDNKDKGAFYTPKEIVHYMCQESLTEYLCTILQIDNAEKRQLIEQLVKSHEVSSKLHNCLNDIKMALDRVKICDPAIGSGAFPMGLLQEIFAIKQALWFYEHNDLVRFPASEIKQQIIQNSIYGVDIEKGAVDIARLRFWLSLVVDETTPQPLPNLDYKIMQGNSLIESFEGHDLSKIIKSGKNLSGELVNSQLTMGFDSEQTELNLNMLLKDYFKTNNKEEKLAKKIQIEEQVKEYIKNCAGHTPEIIKKVNNIDFNNKSFFLWHLYFADVFENGGFDILIGNPPYVGEKGHKNIFEPVKNGNLRIYYVGKMDLFYFFFHLAINMLKEKGCATFITTNYYPTALGGWKLREDLKKRVILKILINFNEFKIFDSALGQHNLITLLSKKNNEDALCKIINFIGKGRLDATKNILENIISQANNLSIHTLVSQNELYEGSENYIRLTKEKEGSKRNNILEKISLNNSLLGDVCSVNTGIMGGCDSISNSNIKYASEDIIKKNDIQVGDGVFVLELNNPRDEKSIGLFSETDLLRDFYKNSDIKKYYTNTFCQKRIIFSSKFISNNEKEIIEKALCKYEIILKAIRRVNNENLDKWNELRRGASHPHIFNGPKIVSPQRSKTNTFGYNESQWYASADVYFITNPKKSLSLKYILALLNSKLYCFWLTNQCKMKGDSFELYQKPLSEIPIKELAEAKQLRFIEYADKIINLKKDSPEIDTTTIEPQIDNLVYKLYDLTYDEVKVVDPDFGLSEDEYASLMIE